MACWSELRINRNIVECKVTFAELEAENDSVLIETLWNVKIQFGENLLDYSGINRNIVECKAI